MSVLQCLQKCTSVQTTVFDGSCVLNSSCLKKVIRRIIYMSMNQVSLLIKYTRIYNFNGLL
jgi:hypothetical protein